MTHQDNPFIAARQAFQSIGFKFDTLKEAELLSYDQLSDEQRQEYDWADDTTNFVKIEWRDDFIEITPMENFIRHDIRNVGLDHTGYNNGTALYIHKDNETLIVTKFC